MDALFSERIRPMASQGRSLRPKFDELKRGLAAHPALRKGQRAGAENAVSRPFKFGLLQPENLEKHELPGARLYAGSAGKSTPRTRLKLAQKPASCGVVNDLKYESQEALRYKVATYSFLEILLTESTPPQQKKQS